MSENKTPLWMREANEAMRRDLLGEPRPTPAATPMPADETDPWFVLDFCEGAIRDAITLEDGLDAEAGASVLRMIVNARAARSTPDAGDAALGAALRQVVAELHDDLTLLMIRRAPPVVITANTSAAHRLASLLSRAAQPATEEG